jgi:hypothetical protein
MRPLAVTASVLLVVGLAGCSDGDDPAPDAETTPSATPTPTAPPRAEPPPTPARDACYDLSFDDAVSPTAEVRPVRCRDAHTS